MALHKGRLELGSLRKGSLERGALGPPGATATAAEYPTGAVVFLSSLNVDGTNNSTMSDGDEVGIATGGGAKWVNTGSLGGTFDASGGTGKAPLFKESILNGNPVVRFAQSNVDELVSSLAASNYRFLHDGSDFTVYIGVNYSSDTSTKHVISTTAGAGAGVTGILLRHQATDKLNGYIYNTAVGEVHTIDAGNESANTGDTNVIIYQNDSTTWRWWRNSTSLATDAQNNTPDAATDPEHTLALSGGPASASTNQIDGDVTVLAIYTSAHDADTRAAFLAAYNADFGTSL